MAGVYQALEAFFGPFGVEAAETCEWTLSKLLDTLVRFSPGAELGNLEESLEDMMGELWI